MKVVNTQDMTQVLYLRDQPKPIKHVTFDRSGSYIAASCTDGIIYVYSFSTEEPEIFRKIDGVIRPLETDNEGTSRAVWHPDGRAFAAATATRDVQIVSVSDGEKQRVFSGGHMGDITSIAWSPNGALLATSGADGKVLLWETKTQKILHRYVLKQSKLGSTNVLAMTTPTSRTCPGIRRTIHSHSRPPTAKCTSTTISSQMSTYRISASALSRRRSFMTP